MTTTAGLPFVLHVDDQPDDLLLWKEEVGRLGNVEISVVHPDEVNEANLSRASLVLVDFKLEQWPSRENIDSLALKPENGLALLSVLQEAALEPSQGHPRAFALYTAVIQDIARELPHQPHIISRAHNLEWIFEKTGSKENDLTRRASRVSELATAVLALPTQWPGDTPGNAEHALSKWLNLQDDFSWREAAWRGVRLCRPPLHEFADHTQGIGVLRWALHRVFPYPTFLLDEVHLAARLRVSLASLRSCLESEAFESLFLEATYRGQLHGFLGRRWWRAGVEAEIFKLTADSPGDLRVLHQALKNRVPDLEAVDKPRLFPVLDGQFRLKDRLATQEEVVEIVPDDWPPFADEAWALRSDLENSPELRAIAVEDEEA